MSADPYRAVRQFERMILDRPKVPVEPEAGKLVCTIVYDEEAETVTYVWPESVQSTEGDGC